MSTTPPPFDPNSPFDPTNVNDPRYDPARDPRYDPRWQKAQQRFYRDQQRAAANQARAASRAQTAAWKMQNRAQMEQWKMYWRAQRRTSLIGPVVLIGLGVTFLLIYSHRISPLAFFGWYARWWPVLLIMLGLLRLAEWAVDRARAPENAPPVRYSVGGGVVFLIVILALLGFAARGMQWRSDRNGFGFYGPFNDDRMNGFGRFFAGDKHEEDATPSVHAIAPNGQLTIDNPRGDVTLTGTSDDGQVHLSVHKSVFASSDETAAEQLRNLNVTFDGSDDNLAVRVTSVSNGGADITLLVPATTHVLLNSNRGDVRATNLKAPLSVTANNGDVEVAAVTGPVQLHVNNRRHSSNIRSITGDVSVEGNGDSVNVTDVAGAVRVRGDFFGGGHLQRVTGKVEYHSSRTDLSFAQLYGGFEIDGDDLTADQVAGPSLISTRSRNISLHRVSGDLKITNNHGEVKIDAAPPVGTLTIDNQNGSVEISLPDKAKFNLQGETTDGDTHSDFSGIHADGRGTLSGAENGGGAQVRINTSHGDITVNRNTESPLAPPPPPPRLSGLGTPVPPATPDVEAITRDALITAQSALHDSAEAARDSKQQAKERAREAAEQARQAMRDAQEKQREADRMARDAARQ